MSAKVFLEKLERNFAAQQQRQFAEILAQAPNPDWLGYLLAIFIKKGWMPPYRTRFNPFDERVPAGEKEVEGRRWCQFVAAMPRHYPPDAELIGVVCAAWRAWNAKQREASETI